MYNKEDFKTNSKGKYTGIRCLAAEQLARPNRERELIKQAEAIQAAKVEEQRVRADAILVVIVKLFAYMPCLKAIEV